MNKHFSLIFVVLAGCSSHQNVQNQNFPTDSELEEKVISRIDDLSARPSWFKESEIFKVSEGNVVSLGSSVIPGDHRVDAAARIAQSNAKAGICSAIEQRLEYIFQNAQEGTALDSNQARFIGAEACKMTTTSIRNGKIYWEKISSKRDNGERFTQYKVFASVLMNESELKAAIIEAAKKRSGKGGLSKDFSEKVDKHWDQFTQEGIAEKITPPSNKSVPESISPNAQNDQETIESLPNIDSASVEVPERVYRHRARI